jgi:hypothetical protein
MKPKLLLFSMQNLIRTYHRPVFKRFLLILALCPALCALRPAAAQIPQGFNYQAIARDVAGNPIINTPLPVRITIQSDSLAGTTFWIEEHSGVTTNNFGLFTLILGKGVKKIGSTAATFNDIDWTVTPKFIKTEIDYSGWKTMGSSRLWTVPYSMVAGDLSGALKKLAVTGVTTNMEEALFEVKNKTGQTVFAVYNEGVRVYVDNGIGKGIKGGFAIGGFGTEKAVSQPLFVVDPDSIRAYIDTNTGKAIKGGFAIGGFGTGKLPGEQYLRVTRDSTRINVREPAKGVKGGFAIGGFSAAKGAITPFTSLTPDNYFIGHEAGMSNTTGLYNSFFGYKAGRSNTTGVQNIFIGHRSGFMNTSGQGNLFVGDSSGYQNTSGQLNIFLGAFSGWENTTGYQNINIGYAAGLYNTTGNRNIFVGTAAGEVNTEGSLNVLVGNFAGNRSTGNNNVCIGSRSGLNNSTGFNNVYIGFEAGRNDTTGIYNVFIGHMAGRDETSSHKLYISNNPTKPLLYGDFLDRKLTIAGDATSNTFYRTFFVNGDAGGMYAWSNDSDKKLKHDIITIPDALQKILKLRGVNFLWNEPKEGMDGLQMGFIGQEAAEIVPEVVSVKNDHYAMQYAPVTALLVEGMKEQQKQIETAKQENRQLKSELDELKAMVNNLIANQTMQGNK